MATLGELADALYAKDEKITEAAAKVKELETERAALVEQLMGLMKAQETTIARGKRATVSLTENKRPSIADFEAFKAFLVRNKAYHLFERRIAVTAYRELMEQRRGKPIPGISEFTKENVLVRKV